MKHVEDLLRNLKQLGNEWAQTAGQRRQCARELRAVVQTFLDATAESMPTSLAKRYLEAGGIPDDNTEYTK